MIRYVTTIIKRTKIIHLFTTSIKWQQLKPKEGNVAQKSDLGTMFCGLLLSKLTTWMNQGWSPMNGCCLSLCLHDQLLESNKNAIAIILNQGRRKEGERVSCSIRKLEKEERWIYMMLLQKSNEEDGLGLSCSIRKSKKEERWIYLLLLQNQMKKMD